MTIAEAIAQIREALDFTADEATSVLPLTRAETARQALTALDSLEAEMRLMREEIRLRVDDTGDLPHDPPLNEMGC